MKKTILLGDSITDWNPLQDKNIINMGVAGDTTRDIFWRIDEVKSIEAEKVIFMAGINDILMKFPFEKTCNFYNKTVSSLKESFDEIILMAILPAVGDNKINVNTLQVNRFIENLAKENNLIFLDLSKLFFDEEGSLKLSFYTDGLHLSSLGYKYLNRELLKII
ncbi:GDSL-type esterase/lipase family protein [uncultured Ilyobacter sp.]|uniref:GDSL-type esterase/lipase family protein n=1 Tax=uncultured Ilyobacter sp. TaxID=544433 RepID=UPI0029F4FDFA|nr:GDSL-type esterase/lipase family protein [uncultured Ilyobacter sp.]